MKLLALLLCLSFVVCCGGPAAPRPTAAERREAAYRANNRGVGLLEQFAYDRASAAFQEALQIDPAVRLARINLAIALYYAGQIDEAASTARSAQEDYPDAPEPSYLLGLIARAQNQPDEAIRQFERVLRVDRNDPGARTQLAMVRLDQRRYQDAAALAESALDVEPYNATAAYTAAMALTRMGDRRAPDALQRFERLRTAPYAITYSQSYLEQGRYAEAIPSSGVEPGLVSTAEPAVTFTDATAQSLSSTTATAPAPARVAVTLADIDADGDLDLLAGGSSLRIFRNEQPRFIEIAGVPPRIGAVNGIVAGDLTNDGRTDVLVLTAAGTRLLTQMADGSFAQPPNPLPQAPMAARTAALVDVDHDGDLDVYVGGATSRLLRNNGNGSFTDVTATARLGVTGDVVAVAPMDFDNRRDIDLVLVGRAVRPMVFRNLRTGAFEDVGAAVGTPGAADYTAMAAGDVNKDGFTDLLLGRESASAIWMLSDRAGRFRLDEAPAGTRGMTAVQLLDYDNDGLLDMFAIARGRPQVFRNVGGGWTEHAASVAALRPATPSPPAVAAIAAGDLDLDGDTDVVAAAQDGGIRIWRNDQPAANRALQVTLTGRASNRAGVGSKVEVRAGSLYQRIETTAATPPVTPAGITVGLGTRSGADVIRVLWPSGVLQAEIPSGTTPAQVARVALIELDRKPSSCPYLYTWNGERFEFVTDFMGGGEMGYLEEPPAHRNIPDPDEYVRITERQLRERDGRLEIRVTNELEEVLFLDHLSLLAVAHPADTDVFPDEGMRLQSRPFTTYTIRDAGPLRMAVDEHGHDILPQISRRDRRFADDFERLDVRGYARDHAVVVDLAGLPRPAAHERTVLLLTGWTDYAFSTDNVRAHQAGLALKLPTLQVESRAGAWQTVDPDIGIPVGRPQTVVVDVTRYAPRRIRILTSMRVYWDEVLVGTAIRHDARPSAAALTRADLRWRGFSKEVSIEGHALSYDYATVSTVNPWKLMVGRYTREGDVRELLAAADDRFVIARPGDEVVLSFDASTVPRLEPGMRRTYLLYSVGFSKEMDLHSASPDTVGPIPFRRMTTYPFGWPEQYPHQRDLATFHTRAVSRSIPPLLGDATPGGAGDTLLPARRVR